MKFRTKKRRLLAIMDAYCEKTNKKAVSTEEVSAWAVEAGLWPVPAHAAGDRDCEEWEQRLEQAKRTVTK